MPEDSQTTKPVDLTTTTTNLTTTTTNLTTTTNQTVEASVQLLNDSQTQSACKCDHRHLMRHVLRCRGASFFQDPSTPPANGGAIGHAAWAMLSEDYSLRLSSYTPVELKAAWQAFSTCTCCTRHQTNLPDLATFPGSDD